jgi:hypothetical protein
MKLLSEMVEPTVTQSTRDKELPKRAIPKIDNAEPSRIKLRSDNVEPKWRKSITDRDDPRRAIP